MPKAQAAFHFRHTAAQRHAQALSAFLFSSSVLCGIPVSYTHLDVYKRQYGDRIKMVQRIPKALSDAMADMMYLANLRTEEEKAQYYRDLLAVQ